MRGLEGNSDFNLLVCSDLHLGGTLRGEDIFTAPGASLPFAALRRAVRHDKSVEKFLDYHRHNTATDELGRLKPWRLVLNGDIFDFLHIDVMPTGDQAAEPSEDEERYGLSFAENRSCWKMGVICSIHRRTVRALARFVDAGHQCVFILGNHDVDLWFDKVRNGLLDALELVSSEPEKIRQRVRFEPWFYFEENRVYVEHGHRFDPYNTFPDPLQPIVVTDQRQLAPTFGHFSLRYFCNRVRSFPIYDMDKNPMSKIVNWVIKRPKKEVFMAFVYWLSFLWRYIRANFLIRRSADQKRASLRQRRREKLRHIAESKGLTLKDVLSLDGLKRRHVGASFARLAQSMLLDLIALFSIAGASVVAIIAVADGWNATVATSILVLFVCVIWYRLNRTRPIFDVQPMLGRLARKIGRITGAKVVVFGHTHKAAIEKRGATQWLNPGSWEHLPWSDVHDRTASCTCALRYGVITGTGRYTQLYLVDWCATEEVPVGARQTTDGYVQGVKGHLSQGVGSLHSRLNHILGRLRDRAGHVAALRNKSQVAESEMR
ncbi:MAG: metallophosphoesterase [Myxococcota bacterium]|nr:metallophosphoesterase [Myxococcota bacterium]